MTLKNGKVHKLEAGAPGIPRIHHLEMHRACDRFLASRGIIAEPPDFRRSAWLYATRRKSS